MKGRKRLLLDLKEVLLHSECDEKMQRYGREGDMATRTRVRKYGRNQVSWGTCISREAVKRLVASVTTKEKDKMK